MNRRAQKPITIRSNRAAELLARHTRFGRSQAEVIEEALEHLPPPDGASEEADWVAKLEDILDRVAEQPRRYVSMAEFDAHEYDERGNPR